MSENYGRSPVEVAEDQILQMLEINKASAFSPNDATIMQISMEQLNKSAKEWEEVLDNLIKSQDNTAAWLANVNHTYCAFMLKHKSHIQ